jgi:hypothetical protein
MIPGEYIINEPEVDIHETENALVVLASLPGYTPVHSLWRSVLGGAVCEPTSRSIGIIQTSCAHICTYPVLSAGHPFAVPVYGCGYLRENSDREIETGESHWKTE